MQTWIFDLDIYFNVEHRVFESTSKMYLSKSFKIDILAYARVLWKERLKHKRDRFEQS